MSTERKHLGRATVSFDGGAPIEGELYATPIKGEHCPHGDVACPCQDYSGPCQYEGDARLPCPNPPPVDPRQLSGTVHGMYFHCHVEGCDDDGGCALARLGLPSNHRRIKPGDTYLDGLRGTPSWWCGVRRAVAADLDWQ